MTHIWQGIRDFLRSGAWLTPARGRAYSLILLAVYGLAIAGWIAASHSLIDRNGKPIGTDFSSFYAAGMLAREGRAADAYAPVAQHAREQRIFGADTPFYSWLYPPVFFFVTAPLAAMPYPLALAVWQGTTLALYLLVIASILRAARERQRIIADNWLLVATAFPAVFINLGHGQNGFLTAALLGAALINLPRRPVLAGSLMGLLCYKPQFALLFPVALLAAGQWRAIAAAGATAIALAVASYLVFGADAWAAFFASTELSRKLLLEQGSAGFEKLQSVFAAVRLWGGGIRYRFDRVAARDPKRAEPVMMDQRRARMRGWPSDQACGRGSRLAWHICSIGQAQHSSKCGIKSTLTGARSAPRAQMRNPRQTRSRPD